MRTDTKIHRLIMDRLWLKTKKENNNKKSFKTIFNIYTPIAYTLNEHAHSQTTKHQNTIQKTRNEYRCINDTFTSKSPACWTMGFVVFFSRLKMTCFFQKIPYYSKLNSFWKGWIPKCDSAESTTECTINVKRSTFKLKSDTKINKIC